MTPRPDLGEFLDEEIYPALFKKMDKAFPDYGWEWTEGPESASWTATSWPADFPFKVNGERPDRLRVYPDRPYWIKIHGHSGIRFLDLVNGGRRPTGQEFVNAVRKLCDLTGVPFPELELSDEEKERFRAKEARRAILETFCTYAETALWSSGGQDALAYLRGRGLTDEAIRGLGLGFYSSVKDARVALEAAGHSKEDIKTSGVLWSKLQGYTLFPWADAIGQPLTVYGRWPAKTALDERPKTIALPGAGTKASPLYFDRARKAGHKNIVAVEGVLDAAVLQSLGDIRVVAYVAAQFSGLQVKTLKRHKVRSVVIVPDPDGGGDRGALSSVESLTRLGIEPYVAPELPDGLDPDEFALRDGIEAWREHVSKAISGAMHLALQDLGDVTPDSPAQDRRAAVDRLLDRVRQLSGPQAALDREDLLNLAVERTGYPKTTLKQQLGISEGDSAASQAGKPRSTAAGREQGDARKKTRDKSSELTRTETDNAIRLVRLYGRDIRFHTNHNCWLVWDGRRWTEDRRKRVVELVKKSNRMIFKEAQQVSDPEKAKALGQWAIRSLSRTNIISTLDLASSLVPVVHDELDRDPWLLNVQNGTLDLRTGKLRPHRRSDLITRLVPVPYNQTAAAPRWEAFLNRIMAGNAEMIGFLQRAVGYSLTGLTIEQCIFLLWGTGSNGKSVFIELLRAILQDFAQAANFASFLTSTRRDGGAPSEDIARWDGARFVTAAEPDPGKALSESVIKMITGGDTISARRLHGHQFDFIPVLKLWLAANHKPRVRGQDDGIWRRIKLIPFTVKIPESERDKDLPRKLRQELPSILNWAVQGCLAWQERGLDFPTEVREASDDYRQEENLLAGFFDARCCIGPSFWAQASDLYTEYKQYCVDTNDNPVTQKAFGGMLTEQDFKRRKVNGYYRWYGIGLVSKREGGEHQDHKGEGDHGDHADLFSGSSSRGTHKEKTQKSGPNGPHGPLDDETGGSGGEDDGTMMEVKL